jgi:hypothetical protein
MKAEDLDSSPPPRPSERLRETSEASRTGSDAAMDPSQAKDAKRSVVLGASGVRSKISGAESQQMRTSRPNARRNVADQSSSLDDDDQAERDHLSGVAKAEGEELRGTSESADPAPAATGQLDPSEAWPFPTEDDSEHEEPEADAQQISIAVAHNDDPWTSDLDDKLGITEEAKSFARLAVSRSFKPPMAVGVFGEWGSGKSYFMRLVHEHVSRLASPAQKPPEGDRQQYLENIVQVRFNAWHYAETNLWASLIDHLFTELNTWLQDRNGAGSAEGVMDALSTARSLTLQSLAALLERRRQQHSAAERLAIVQSELEDAKAAAAISARTYWQVLRSVLEREQRETPELAQRRTAFEEAAEDAGIADLARGTVSLFSVSRDLTSTAGQLRLTVGALASKMASKWSIALLVTLVVVAPMMATFALKVLTDSLPLLSRVSDGILQISAILAGAMGWLAVVGHAARAAIRRLNRARATLDEVITKETSKQSAAAKNETQRVASLNAAVVTAQADFNATTDRLQVAHSEFTSSSGAERLIQFIRSRTGDGHYAKHLGLIANIRRDIEELATAVSGARTVESETIARDRERFRNVLAEFAKNEGGLLNKEEIDQISKLQKSVFAADNNSVGFDRVVLYIDDLDRCPPEKVVDVLQAVNLLLTFPIFVVFVAVDVRWVRRSLAHQYSALVSATGEAGAITPDDYLEKIFQIPYWVRPMDESSSSKFVLSRLRALVQEDFTEPAEDLGREAAVISPDEAEPPRAALLQLVVYEVAFMGKLAPHAATSPRRALRFMNSYRLVRASLGGAELVDLLDGGYAALLVQLAIATGAPDLMPAWVVHAEKGNSSANFDHTPCSRRGGAVLSSCLRLYAQECQELGLDEAMASAGLKRYARTASRYSFGGASD